MKMKKLRVIILAVIVVIVLLFGAVFMFASRVVEAGIESGATNSLGTQVGVGDVDLAIFKGRIRLSDITVANPNGFEHANLLRVGVGFVEASLGSLLSDTVQVRQIKLDGAELFIEQKGMSTNLQQIMKNMPVSEQEQPAKEGKKLQIDLVELTNTTVNIKFLPVGGTEDTMTLELAPIKMVNLGSDKEINTGQLAAKILMALAAGVASQGAGELPDAVIGGVKEALGAGMEAGGEILGTGQKLLEEGAEGGKGAIKGIEGLFKNDKQNQD